MTNPLLDLLAEKGVLLADGATGTNLFNMGLESGEPPEFWNTDAPDKILTLYRGAVNAGSDVFLTNSFGANASRLKLHKAQNRAHELSRVSAELAREVADTAGRKVIVAGSVGPTGEIMEPVGGLSHASAVEMFHETADGLKAGGADIGWLETISAPEEYRAAAEGFALAGLPWVGTMSFDTAGRTMMGMTSAAMAEMVEGLENAPDAFGANCGTGASDLLRTVLGFSAKEPKRPIIAKGNAGIPKYVEGHIHYDGTPELMATYAVMARNCGAQIIGGCCGTMPAHLERMRDALDSRPKGEKPELEQITSALGPFSSESDGTDGNAPVRAARKGRRRS
ncbi:betaine--homocysteine S-methyltransferase [Sulfitobacter guttiformis]|uniref:5-methyltetrahydrofolate--homocysteine methyltransferase n=1 Tax=Sulfitobacter guttiformis TaxID=74349 RepID=A0A420DHK3_9RHOB|nr:betaine--homocysteine S-methyltransferase [Sulfitobacter guttiformis]KIN72544.1 Methionine synthase I [Sulfitobacter guttiformis KCTC 32187]RKE93711.1 5-methyltetrahydrofolate--homocysteine methyltransferase [Sulfitobacter guttiformis]